MSRACLTLLFLVTGAALEVGSLADALGQTREISGLREAARYVRLFTPPRVPAGTYTAYTSSQDLATVLQQLGVGIEARSVLPADAFGQNGGYNRWKLALLYGARRVRVARFPRIQNGEVVEAWTLMSPYPDAELERLLPGTLLIVLRVRND